MDNREMRYLEDRIRRYERLSDTSDNGFSREYFKAKAEALSDFQRSIPDNLISRPVGYYLHDDEDYLGPFPTGEKAWDARWSDFNIVIYWDGNSIR